MSDGSFGLKIGVEGEREFKKALADINQQFKVLGSEMKLATSQFGRNEQSVESLTSKNEVLEKQIESQKNKISTLRSALQNASDSFGESDRRTQQWTAALNNAEAELNDMEREVSDNRRAIDAMGNGMDSASADAKQLGRAVDSSGKESDGAKARFEALGSTAKATAAAMAAAFAAVATAAVAAGKALADMTRAGAVYADGVLTTSAQTGIATDKLQEYMYASELVDVPVETLTKSMAKQIKSMYSASEGTKSYTEAYEKLGVSVLKADGSLRDSDEVYWQVIDSLGSMSNETERDAIAMMLLGKSAQELNPLIEAGAERMSELGEQAHMAGYVMSDELLAAYGAFDDQCQYLAVGAQAVKNALGTILLPLLTQLAGEGVSFLGEFSNALLEANGDVGKVGEVIRELLPEALNKVMECMPVVNEVVYSIIASIGTAVLENLPQIVDSAGSIVFSFLESFMAALPAITMGAVQLITTLAAGLLANLPALAAAALEMVAALATGIAESLPELVPSAVEAVILVCETLLDNMDRVLEAAGEIITGLAKGLVDALPALIDALPQIISAIVDFITENLPTIVATGVTLIVQLAVGIVQAIPQLVGALPKVVAAIIEGVGKAAVSIVEVGKSIVQGLWSGISAMISWLWQKVSGWVSNLVGGIRSALGIRSPSKVFAGIGENMGKGIGVGFTDAMQTVSEDMRKSIPTTFDIGATLRGVNAVEGISPDSRAFNVTIPLTMNGATLTRILAQIQWSQNAVYVRNLGVG